MILDECEYPLGIIVKMKKKKKKNMFHFMSCNAFSNVSFINKFQPNPYMCDHLATPKLEKNMKS
jgi:hypothetical protein